MSGHPSAHPAIGHRRRWPAFMILCCGVLMITLDSTIVNVALPAIRTGLGFSEASLVWVVNAYLLAFSGFLLLGGRLGDLFGHRRIFLFGIGLFTLASLECGLASSKELLIGARAVQGLGGAGAAAVALSLTSQLFSEATQRLKAIGLFGFASVGGEAVGLVLGGVLTSALNWHWIFLVNIPVGVAVCLLGRAWLPEGTACARDGRLDIGGAVTVTGSLVIFAYVIVSGNNTGWTSPRILGLAGSAALLMGLFLGIESRVAVPLVPLGLLQRRNLAVANFAGALFFAAMFSGYFICALYLQLVLRYSPLQAGLIFLPANLIPVAFSVGLSAKVVTRFGIQSSLTAGLLFSAGGLALLALAPVDGHLTIDVLPGITLLGVGIGMASNPLLLTAMNDVGPSESGLASGAMNTACVMGGSLGLAVVVSTAAARTSSVLACGVDPRVALNSGYHIAFVIGAIFAAVASGVVGFLGVERTAAVRY